MSFDLKLPVILDGAMGTRIIKRGFTPGSCPELWYLENRDIVIEIQRGYVEAGSNIIYSPTFGTNRGMLGNYGLEDKVAEFNEKLVGISREAAGGKALVAGDISSLGAMLYPLGETRFEEMVEMYSEQVIAQDKAGVDLFAIETMGSLAEARAALIAVRENTNKPAIVTFNVDENGKTLTGTDITAAQVVMQGMGADAFGINCSSGPDIVLPQIRRLGKYMTVPLAAKPNAGLPQLVDGENVYSVDPAGFAEYIPAFAAAGVKLFGSCCGSDERYIEAVKRALADLEPLSADQSGCTTGETCSEDRIICASEKNVFELGPDAEISRTLACDDDLEDELIDAEEGEIIGISIGDASDLEMLEECQCFADCPLAICTDDADLLEKALRICQGRVLYSGELTAEALEPLKEKYGLIVL